VVLLENATAIPNFGADTFYPAEDRFGQFVTGFDDGGILGVVAVSNQGARSTTGAAVVSGGADWRNLTVRTVNGDRPVPEPAGPMVGRYTSANAAVNGTWWTGTYGLGFDRADDPQRIMMGPFVGFRWSRDGGATWHGPAGHSVANGIFGERPGDAVKMGSPHVVDHGPENRRSPDGALYLVAGGCTAPSATDNCTWISGDGIFVARCTSFDASRPESLNDPACWEFWGGPAMGWVQRIGQARPAFAWKGRVGAVTATLDPRTGKYLFCVTAPNAHPWNNIGPFDTYFLEADSLVGPFRMLSYLPKFGQQAYFVSAPSAWMTGERDAVLTFSANFACKTEGCAANIAGARYGANLLPVTFTDEVERKLAAEPSGREE
jgi:hypothetical protein